MSKPIHYEPHPVSAERKAELRDKGFTIVDAIYAPKEDAKPVAGLTREDIDKMPRAEVIELLETHGIEGATGKVADLRNWAKRVTFVEL